MTERTVLVLVQFAVTLKHDDAGKVVDIAACRGRIVGPGAEVLPANCWQTVEESEGVWGAVAKFGECAERILSHATIDLWDCALDVLKDPDEIPPDPVVEMLDKIARLRSQRDDAVKASHQRGELIADAANQIAALVKERNALRTELELKVPAPTKGERA